MEELFIKDIFVQNVRHITNLDIPLSEEERKHLIITGKNGSGKTSLLEVLKNCLKNLIQDATSIDSILKQKRVLEEELIKTNTSDIEKIAKIKKDIDYQDNAIKAHIRYFGGAISYFNTDQEKTIINSYKNGKFILAFFEAKRNRPLKIPTGINKTNIKQNYGINEIAGSEFIQYIVNLKADRLFSKEENDLETVAKIDEWFTSFEENLQKLFGISGVKLQFDHRNYRFNFVEEGKEPYDFTQLSDGYAAILSIVTELIMRMENHKVKNYDVQGVVLIDEVETHLHIDLQKKIMPFLTSFFPKIQFIVTTHSPFVISSIENAVVCDLEKRIVTSDLSGYSYDTLIESYFDSDKYSDILKTKIADYERLVDRQTLTEGEKDTLWELKQYLEEIPKFVADELAVKLQQIKLKELNKKRNNGIFPKVQ